MKKLSLLLLVSSISLPILAQRKVVFPSEDGVVQVTALLYETNPDYPWIVLFHQALGSKGEYRDIAPRLAKLELNCMAVDLRSGRESNFVPNETTIHAKKFGKSLEYIDSEPDMVAAIKRAHGIGRKPVIIMGSSYSASLGLKLAKEMKEVRAVIALSPGEHFYNKLNVKEAVTGLDKPVLIACASSERKWVEELIEGIPTSKRIFYAPGKGGAHGSKMLLKETEGQTEYWVQIINFLQTLKKSGRD